jgi:selenocysteine-specific elongation factor
VHVIGTAGHVDHGKSSLVRALTGTDPDRWIEERLRGMTLDLGFAHLRFEDGVEAGVVDVPGHERFLHNMLAGAAGMELLLLVVAANEGPKAQTLEHLAILEYLGVAHTIVVLTKSDLVDAEELAIARELVQAAIAGTFAAGAPCIAVSTTTGAGLDDLRAAIATGLRGLPPRAPEAPAFLPIDRVFALPGHGTIVTGTLMQGRISTGDELVLVPGDRNVRVRNLHVFGEKRASASGGARVALNLPALETGDAKRGDVIASSQFSQAQSIDVSFRPLPAALVLLKRRTPVRAYLGSAEIVGTLAFESVPDSAAPVRAILHLRTPTLVVPGSAFVVRRLSPKTLLGGGTIGHADARADTQERSVAGDAPEALALLAALRKAGLDGADAAHAGGLANVRLERAVQVLAGLDDDGRVMQLRRPAAFVETGLATELFERACARIANSERDMPWATGVTGLALSRALAVPEPRLARVLAAFVEDGQLAYRNGYYASAGFVPALSAEQQTFFQRLFAGDPAAPNAPFPYDAAREALRGATVPGLSVAFETLQTSGAIVRIADAVYRADQIARVRAHLEATLRAEKQITVSAFRDISGTSRKFAVPLLEWFDANGVTVRSGDVRLLRTKALQS